MTDLQRALANLRRRGHIVHERQPLSYASETRYVVHFKDCPGAPHVVRGAGRLIREASELND